MELSQLKYFYETAKIEHVTRASEELHIAQPALTKSIKALENELGVKLFYRSGRRIKLTEYGLYLRDKLTPILEELEALPITVEKMTDMAENTITLNVLAASTIVTDIVIGFKKTHPDVIFKMIQNESEPNCNILVTTNTLRPANLSNVTKRGIVEEKIYIAVPKSSPLAEKDKIALKEVKHENFVNLLGSKLFRTVCDRFCEYAGFKPQIIFESDSPFAVKNLIGAGVGVSFWPEFSWGKISAKDIKLLNITSPVCQREIIVYLLHTGIKSKISEEFYEYMLKKLSERKN